MYGTSLAPFQELERLINTDFSGRSCDEGGALLTVQIRSLLSRLDVLLEAMNDLKRQARRILTHHLTYYKTNRLI